MLLQACSSPSLLTSLLSSMQPAQASASLGRSACGYDPSPGLTPTLVLRQLTRPVTPLASFIPPPPPDLAPFALPLVSRLWPSQPPRDLAVAPIKKNSRKPTSRLVKGLHGSSGPRRWIAPTSSGCVSGDVEPCGRPRYAKPVGDPVWYCNHAPGHN